MGTPTRAMPPMVRAGSVTWAEKLEQSCNSMHSPHHSSSHIRRTCLKQVRNNNRVVHVCVCQWPNEPLRLCAHQILEGTSAQGPAGLQAPASQNGCCCCLGTPPACLPRVLSSRAPASDTFGCCPGHQTHMSAVQTLSNLQHCAPEDVAQPTDACQEMSHNRSRPIRIDGHLTGQAHCLLPGRKRSHFQMAVD